MASERQDFLRRTIHWTLHKLKREIEQEFAVTIGTTPLWNHIRRMGLVLKKPVLSTTRQTKKNRKPLKKINDHSTWFSRPPLLLFR